MILYDEIFTFIKVFESKSYTIAAKLLGVSQPSIRRQIQNLESEFGKEMVHSTVNSIEITEFGNRVYDHFKNKGQELESIVSSLLEESQAVEGELRVTLPINLSAKLITPYLPEFLQKHPNLKLKLNLKQNEPNLFSTGFDIAVSLVLPTQQSLIVKSLFKTKVGLYSTKEYADRYGIPKTFGEIRKDRTLSHLDIHDPRKSLPIIFTNKNTGESVLAENNCTVALNNATNGMILLRTGEFIMGLEEYEFYLDTNTDLIPILPEYEVTEQKYYLILPSKYKNSKTQAFCNFLDECIQRYEDYMHTKTQNKD